MARDDEHDEFLAAMAALGLEARGGRQRDPEGDAAAFAAAVAALEGEAAARMGGQEAARTEAAETAKGRPKRASQEHDLSAEDAAFLAAMAGLDGGEVNGDPHEEGERARRAPEGGHTPRALLRRVRSGAFGNAPALDLHGLTRDAARLALRGFLQRAVAEGHEVVRVVTGRGLHSRGEAVLQRDVPRWLEEERGARVRQWVKAPAAAGGEGALYVQLVRAAP